MDEVGLWLPEYYRTSDFLWAPIIFKGSPGDSVVKNLQDLSLGLEDSPGEGKGNPLQYSCQDNPMDRGAWRAAVHGVAKELDTT